MISVTEAHQRWGDLAKIINGHTYWKIVRTPEGDWHPIFDPSRIELIGYELRPQFQGRSGPERTLRIV